MFTNASSSPAMHVEELVLINISISSSPAYLRHRRIFKGHLCPDDYKLPDHRLAALIIRKSTFLPDIITPLYVVREAGGSNPGRDIIVGEASHPTRQLGRFSPPNIKSIVK